MHKPVIPDFHETGWQYALEESPDELKCRKVNGLVIAVFGIGVPEEYPFVLHGEDTMI